MLPILSNLMSSINFFKDLNSGQSRFMVSHTEKNFKTSLYEAELGIFIKDNFNIGYQHKGCEKRHSESETSQMWVWASQPSCPKLGPKFHFSSLQAVDQYLSEPSLPDSIQSGGVGCWCSAQESPPSLQKTRGSFPMSLITKITLKNKNSKASEVIQWGNVLATKRDDPRFFRDSHGRRRHPATNKQQ